MGYQVLARRWRPKLFKDLIGQDYIRQALTNSLAAGRLHHAYLFSGTRGVGKTTIGRILAKALNCEQGVSAEPCGECAHCQAIDAGQFVDLIEVDAASRTKVEDTRELLDNVQYSPSIGRYKVYLIDEVHMLSGHSFNALLKTLEEPPEHVIFLLATTDPQKLPVTVQSRCLHFHLKNMTPADITRQLEIIIQADKIKTESGCLDLLSQAADGSMRDALSLLDQAIAYTNNHLTLEAISTMLGWVANTQLNHLLQNLAEKDQIGLLATCRELAALGVDWGQVLRELSHQFHQITLEQLLPGQYPDLSSLAQQINPLDIQLWYDISLRGQRELPLAPTPQIGFEMTLIRMLAFTPTQPKLSDKLDWADIIPKLNLEGMALQLVQHMQATVLSPTNCELQLHPVQSPLFNDKLADRIRKAVRKYFNQATEIKITIADASITTPAGQVAEQRAALGAEVKQDPRAAALSSAFGATLEDFTVKQ